jgi:hypothetical protein
MQQRFASLSDVVHKLECATPTLSFESASTSFSALVLHHLRLAFMARNHLGFVTLHLV